jgi:NADPH:quinone reductase-like Zn-dependent oxidoreductase
VVEAVGKNVTQFKVGDEVFGGRAGALAQYICAKADRGVALKPATITFEEAGSIAVAGITALQGLRDKGNVQAGQKVLINGASGGVGTFAVQIAKALGAEVTGVCSTRNVDLVKSLGADHVIDYTKEDFTKGDQHYDVLFDNVQNHTFSERRRALTPNGICLNVGLGGAGWREDTALHMMRAFTTPLMSKFTSQKFKFFIAQLNHNDLAYLADLIQSGKMKPVIDRTYNSLSEVPQALAYLEEGHARGKVVINVN